MKILGTITTKLADHDSRLHDMAPLVTTETQPGPSLATTNRDCLRVAVLIWPRPFDGMEEQVRHGVAEHLQGVLPANLPTTDEESGDDEQTTAQPWQKH